MYDYNNAYGGPSAADPFIHHPGYGNPAEGGVSAYDSPNPAYSTFVAAVAADAAKVGVNPLYYQNSLYTRDLIDAGNQIYGPPHFNAQTFFGTWYQDVEDTLNKIADANGQSGFNFLPYAWTAVMNISGGYGRYLSSAHVVNNILSVASMYDPSWAKYMLPDAAIQQADANSEAFIRAHSDQGGFLSDAFAGVMNISKVLAPFAGLMALPALMGQSTLFDAIMANASGATGAAATTAAATGGEAIASSSISAETATAGELYGGADIGSGVAADLAAGGAAAAPYMGTLTDATGTSLQSIAENALKNVGVTPTTAVKYGAGLLATVLGPTPAKPALRSGVTLAPAPGIGNAAILAGGALLLFLVMNR